MSIRRGPADVLERAWMTARNTEHWVERMDGSLHDAHRPRPTRSLVEVHPLTPAAGAGFLRDLAFPARARR